MRRILLSTALFAFASPAFPSEWKTVTSDKYSGQFFSERYYDENDVEYYEFSSTIVEEGCTDASKFVDHLYEQVSPSYKKMYPDAQWRLVKGDRNIKGNVSSRHKKMKSAFCVIPYSIEYLLPDSDKEETVKKKTPEEICQAKPPVNGTFTHVYDGYANYEGCEYEATGVIVCNSKKTECAADWKPTGEVGSDGDNGNGIDGETDGGDSDKEDLNNGSHSSSSGGKTDNSANNSHGDSSLTEEGIEAVVNRGIESASSRISDDIKSTLTEEYENDNRGVEDETKSNISRLENNLNDGLRGAGTFADRFGKASSHYGGEGTSEMDSAIRLAESELNIDKGSHGAMWESFLNERVLRPYIPTGHGCSTFTMFSGSVYQVDIGCDKLDDIKSILSWVMYCLTFWYIFSSITSLLRKGSE
jgi:hypothetical protein